MKRMKRITQYGLTLLFAALNGHAMADEILVIPDTTAAYLYDGAGSKRTAGNEVSVALFKEGHFKEYLIESKPPGLVCDEKCEETAQNLPEGKVTLRIVGKKPVSFLDIPLTGKWSAECEQDEDVESSECVVLVDEMTSQIRVSVSPDIEVGTIMRLPEGGSAMIVQVDMRTNTVTVAGHQRLGPGVTWLEFAQEIRYRKVNATSPLDGYANTMKLLPFGSNAAHYCYNMSRDTGQNWYLPASYELGLLTKTVLDKIPGIEPDNYLWSSTENGLSIRKNKDGEETFTYSAHAMNNGSASMSTNRDAYSCTVKKDGTNDCKNIRRYQTLCFRRLPI